MTRSRTRCPAGSSRPPAEGRRNGATSVGRRCNGPIRPTWARSADRHLTAPQCSPAGGCGIGVCIRSTGSCHSGGAKGDRFRALSRRGQDRVQGAWRETAPRAPTLPPPGPPASPGTARRFSLSPHQRDRMASELACRTLAPAMARWASMPRLRWHRGRSRWRRSWESATSPDCRYGRSRRTDVLRAGNRLTCPAKVICAGEC